MTNTPVEKKPREFWLVKDENTYLEVKPGHPTDHLIHVVEMSAYNSLQVRVKELEWLEKNVNRYVLPGELDTQDSVCKTLYEMKAKITELENSNLEVARSAKALLVAKDREVEELKNQPHKCPSCGEEFTYLTSTGNFNQNSLVELKEAKISELENKLLSFEGMTFSENAKIAELEAENKELKELNKDIYEQCASTQAKLEAAEADIKFHIKNNETGVKFAQNRIPRADVKTLVEILSMLNKVGRLKESEVTALAAFNAKYGELTKENL